jgi:hypothetical protein
MATWDAAQTLEAVRCQNWVAGFSVIVSDACRLTGSGELCCSKIANRPQTGLQDNAHVWQSH